MISRAQLAEHWQVTPQAISKLRKRGCPMTSLADADAWRTRNISKRSTGKASRPIDNKLTVEETEADSMMAAEGRLHRPTVEKNLRLLDQLTEQARAAVTDALARGESENARRWSITLLNVIARSAIVAKSLQELLETDEVTIRLTEAHEVVTRGLVKQRDLVASAVDTLPHQIAPSDPDGCRDVMREWYLHTFLRSMYNEFSDAKIPREQWPQAAHERDA